MAMEPRRRFDERNTRSMAAIAALLDEKDIDQRLSAGQLHAAAVEALGCEPIVFVCNLLAMAVHARSKITIQPAEAAKIALGVMDRIYGPADVKARKRDNMDQFELSFAWSQAPSQDLVAVFESEDSRGGIGE